MAALPMRSWMRWAEPTLPEDAGAPTIKNHSVTFHDGLLYSFGGYDGQKNHQTLMVYGLAEKKWREARQMIRDGPVASGGSLEGVAGDTVMEDATPTGGRLRGEDGPPSPKVVSSQGGRRQGGEGPTIHAVDRVDIGGQHAHSADTGVSASASTLPPGRIYVSGNPPPGRNGHTATLVSGRSGEDARIVIIGGWLGTGPLAASDLHVLDVSSGVESLRWYQPTVRGEPPGPCNMHSADFIAPKNEIYVFRGGNGREYLNDLHALDVATYTWRPVITQGEAPQQRANHSSAVLEETSELFIFGGWNGRERLNDIHILNTETGVWSKPRVGGDLPYPRAGMTLTALRGRLYLFGGSGTSSKCFNDLQILDRKEMAWLNVTQLKDSEPSSSKQANTGDDDDCVPHTVTGVGANDRRHLDWGVQEIRTVAHSMQSGNPNDEDTVPTIFVQGNGPGRRAGHTATAVDRRIIVFGGSCGSDYLNDFFLLDSDPSPSVAVTQSTSIQLCERRLRHFYDDEEFSDVVFIVEGRRLYGHKLVLSLVSDCFRAMFTTKYGTGTGFREASSDCSEIEIPNCTYDTFVTMMEYIYTGHIPKTSIDSVISGDEGQSIGRAVELLELADQFFLEHLKQLCERMLKPAITADTVDYFLQISQKTNARQLEAVCRHFERNIDNMSESNLERL